MRLAVLSAFLGVGTSVHSSASAQTAATASSALPTEAVVLRVSLNSVDKGDVFAQRSGLDGFFLKVEDLKTFGLREPSGLVVVFDAEPYL